MNKKGSAVEGPEGRETKTNGENPWQKASPRSVAKAVVNSFVNCISRVLRWCKQVQCGKLIISDFAKVFVTTAKMRSHLVISLFAHMQLKLSIIANSRESIQRTLSDQFFACNRNKIQRNTQCLLVSNYNPLNEFQAISINFS